MVVQAWIQSTLLLLKVFSRVGEDTCSLYRMTQILDELIALRSNASNQYVWSESRIALLR